MLNALRDMQGTSSASALQDIQEMDISALQLLLVVGIVLTWSTSDCSHSCSI